MFQSPMLKRIIEIASWPWLLSLIDLPLVFQAWYKHGKLREKKKIEKALGYSLLRISLRLIT